MPSYVCTTVTGRLSAGQRTRLADQITRVHHEVTGAPTSFARVAFHDVEPDTVFVGGAPLQHDHVFVVGHVRGDRPADMRAALITGLAAVVGRVAGVASTGVWVYLVELPAAAMVEFGHVLPEPGRERQWTAALPPEDRAMLAALEQ